MFDTKVFVKTSKFLQLIAVAPVVLMGPALLIGGGAQVSEVLTSEYYSQSELEAGIFVFALGYAALCLLIAVLSDGDTIVKRWAIYLVVLIGLLIGTAFSLLLFWGFAEGSRSMSSDDPITALLGTYNLLLIAIALVQIVRISHAVLNRKELARAPTHE